MPGPICWHTMKYEICVSMVYSTCFFFYYRNLALTWPDNNFHYSEALLIIWSKKQCAVHICYLTFFRGPNKILWNLSKNCLNAWYLFSKKSNKNHKVINLHTDFMEMVLELSLLKIVPYWYIQEQSCIIWDYTYLAL